MSNTYKWRIEPSDPKKLQKQLEKLPCKDRMAVFEAIRRLAEADNPCAVAGVKKLVTGECTWRQRVGDYRILFQVRNGRIVSLKCEYKGILLIEHVESRKDVYA